MIDTRWIENARSAFAALYGEKKAAAVCAAVVPGIMKDFRKMLERAEPGQTIGETYRLDDRKGDVRLEGRREGSAVVITRLAVAGRDVDLGGRELIL